MKLKKFKREVRLQRGKLENMDMYLKMIYHNAIPCLIEFTLTKKLMGIQNIAYIATEPEAIQEDFCIWMARKKWKATKNEIDLWFNK